MLDKKILTDIDQLIKDMEDYFTELKKNYTITHNIAPNKDDSKLSLHDLEKLISELKIKRTQFNIFLKYLAQYQSDHSSTIQKDYTNKHDSSIAKEPNENLINNKNILSGGAWEQNRRRH